jgi:hypothetical protein
MDIGNEYLHISEQLYLTLDVAFGSSQETMKIPVQVGAHDGLALYKPTP